jgi:hypothetical protein
MPFRMRSMMAQSEDHKRWLKTIETHYGTLDGFDDATTVRNMRKLLQKDLDQIEGFYKASEDEPEVLDDLKDAFEIERLQIVRFITDLDAWLAKRGLTT